jgi:hypothetical protein
MALRDVIEGLRQEEQEAAKYLERIRSAISALGAADADGTNRRGRPKGNTKGVLSRRKRRLSAKARKAISDAQKARWAKVRRAAQASK